MIGLILAAGIGKRLRPLTQKIPKVLLPLNGCKVIDVILGNLESVGVSKLLFVTGHGEEYLKEYLSRSSWKESFESILYIRNNNYVTTNTAVSLYLGLKALADRGILEDILIINGDVIFDQRIAEKIVNTQKSAIVIDRDKELTAESFKVRIVDGVIVKMGKDIPIESATGEYIGVSKLISKDLDLAMKYLEEGTKKDKNMYYDLLFAYLSRERGIDYVFTDGLLWTEIDFPEDYDYAKKIVKKIKTKANC